LDVCIQPVLDVCIDVAPAAQACVTAVCTCIDTTIRPLSRDVRPHTVASLKQRGLRLTLSNLRQPVECAALVASRYGARQGCLVGSTALRRVQYASRCSALGPEVMTCLQCGGSRPLRGTAQHVTPSIAHLSHELARSRRSWSRVSSVSAVRNVRQTDYDFGAKKPRMYYVGDVGDITRTRIGMRSASFAHAYVALGTPCTVLRWTRSLRAAQQSSARSLRVPGRVRRGMPCCDSVGVRFVMQQACCHQVPLIFYSSRCTSSQAVRQPWGRVLGHKCATPCCSAMHHRY
jgi:hypothetical protein